MQESLSVALSAQIALDRRLTTLADNIANATTPGFRAASVRFEALVAGPQSRKVAFASAGDTFHATRAGELRATANPLDFAIEGDAWFAISTPAGTAMTRDGRFRVDAGGTLVNLDGDPVLDPGGAPIQLNPNGSAPNVGADGLIRQGRSTVGSIGLFAYSPGAMARRHGSSGFLAERPPEPLVDRSDVAMVQGFVEGSNVSPILELTRLIAVQRSFESAASLIRDSESGLSETIRAMGGR